jgi:hypothetical protein
MKKITVNFSKKAVIQILKTVFKTHRIIFNQFIHITTSNIWKKIKN